MNKWITGITPDGSKVIKAPREIWRINIHQKYFINVVLQVADTFSDYFCKICFQDHISKSGLIKCLKIHRNDTVNYYLDNILRGGFQ